MFAAAFLGATISGFVPNSLVGEGSQADIEMIEELTTAAVNAALAKIRKVIQEDMAQLTGGLNLPGLDELTESP